MKWELIRGLERSKSGSVGRGMYGNLKSTVEVHRNETPVLFV